MTNKKTLTFLLSLAIVFPVLASAQAFKGVKEILTAFGGLLNTITKIIFALAFLYFFWGVGQFILHSNDQKAREDGKKRMMWGVVALFVMFSIYGILYFLGETIGFTPASSTYNNVRSLLPF